MSSTRSRLTQQQCLQADLTDCCCWSYKGRATLQKSHESQHTSTKQVRILLCGIDEDHFKYTYGKHHGRICSTGNTSGITEQHQHQSPFWLKLFWRWTLLHRYIDINFLLFMKGVQICESQMSTPLVVWDFLPTGLAACVGALFAPRLPQRQHIGQAQL